MSDANTHQKLSPADTGGSCGEGTCGCCAGTRVETPAEITNRPGLSAIGYRVGTHSQFKRSMLARLSTSKQKALLDLRTRDDDDFTIALVDAWAVVADVLTFYQERIANESYLRTATERVSVLELARIIGYEPARGVAAGTWLAFTVESAAGAPGQATVPVGVQVKSVPGQDEKPQTFETVEEIEARAEWNALLPRLTTLQYPAEGDAHVYLQGTATNLKEGDGLLFVVGQPEVEKGSEGWDFRRVKSVQPDRVAGRTLVTLDRALDTLTSLSGKPARPQVYAMRLRAAVFGYNAPDWRLLHDTIKANYLNKEPKDFTEADKKEWPDFTIFAIPPPPRVKDPEPVIDLDAVYQQVKRGSWVVLSTPEWTEVYAVETVAEAARADFGLSSKTTRLRLDGKNLKEKFEKQVRSTVVFAQSEELPLAETPLAEPVWGDTVELGDVVEGLEAGRKLIVSGRPLTASLRLAKRATGLRLTLAEDPELSVELTAGEKLSVVGPPADAEDGPGQQRWHLLNADGYEGYMTDSADAFIYEVPPGAGVPADKHLLLTTSDEDEVAREFATLARTVTSQGRTRLFLSEPLTNFYERATVVIAANVAQATHGETQGEVLGGGDAARTNQSFKLRQAPLTYVAAETASGAASTLNVRVNDLLWQEVPTLYGRGPSERIYVTRLHDDDSVTVHFGDGRNGARPPTGQENVIATYRKGIGIEGLLKEGQLSLLKTRPLGVKSVTNPLPATGGEDPESEESIRTAAPLTVLTLGRVVSLRDYEDFARTFAGLDKAHAVWTWQAGARGVYVTVAGADGAEVPDGSDLQTKLVGALLAAGAPGVHVKVGSYRPAYFRVVATVRFDPVYLKDLVAAAVESALREHFSFEARAFGQPVALSEVVAVMQNVEGVVAVDVRRLYREGVSGALLRNVVTAELPAPGTGVARVKPAELLTLHSDPLGDALKLEAGL